MTQAWPTGSRKSRGWRRLGRSGWFGGIFLHSPDNQCNCETNCSEHRPPRRRVQCAVPRRERNVGMTLRKVGSSFPIVVARACVERCINGQKLTGVGHCERQWWRKQNSQDKPRCVFYGKTRGHARLRLPAASRLVWWVPWASVPHASGSVPLQPRCLRYYALLRLPSSVPAGSLVAPDPYLGLTRFSACPSQLAPGSARSPSASSGKRQGVVFAGHPCSGSCSQGDGRFSRVPGLPL